ncbi:hypothetical protein GDO81_020291 [Engystomops pustulosus]|uniref:Sulfotransferase n=1 Tax=Engystomops pustulosus TaxID=76066 RepID=A0AAV6ZEL3_ENGPU|nr:hypothetical protein GDO81_020291 [Engystomops pustulosus]
MKIRDSDVFLVTYPKSGTVWSQQILSLIFNEGHRNGTENIDNMTRVPWIEYNIHNMDFSSRPSPRLFSTHLPYYLMPRDLRFRTGKIIYVCRNPKDVMVSFYHFYKLNPRIKHTINWEKFIDLYMSGKVLGGSWFNHVRGWYTHKEDFSILFMTYEEMKKVVDASFDYKKKNAHYNFNKDIANSDLLLDFQLFFDHHFFSFSCCTLFIMCGHYKLASFLTFTHFVLVAICVSHHISSF